MKRSIIWLASYPKSGNTWTRVFLANYLLNTQKPIPINEVHRVGRGDSLAATYHMVAGRKLDFIRVPHVLTFRHKVLQGIVNNNADINLVKTHNARVTAYGVELIPEKFTRASVYIMRNPLDMVLSYARHYGISHVAAVERITHPDNANLPTETSVAEFLGTWEAHVLSWVKDASWPQVVLRYEDLLDDPETEFVKVLDLMGVPVDPERLRRAIRFSSFDELSKQEEESGFIEKSTVSERFFGKGEKDQWKTDLDPALADIIRDKLGPTMKRYGYLE
ncbi:MAG: sulfotransferase [Rhodobacteraceae bacterium CG17_big_fil_post_rev_8_21_14_2_50_63_15]|nr:sulfotransferase domain-containing protein [Roseovarius sp.]PIV79299.1 MAG: sulfotransferase [Rhodobacteraceae bacterium CG17_big_fil_post_rev_8_21_14_2_50_63_15]